MPPLRKKGRGGGGGKTEAPLPGEVRGTSPSVSVSLARKERERRVSSTTTTSSQGVENLGMFVSRSFQKERGEKKLLEASRTSLHLTSGTFQRSLRARRTDASSTDSTPKVVTDVSARREEREKRLTSSTSAGHRPTSACRGGREEPAVCRTSCRELGEEKILYRRSVRAGSSEGKLVRRVVGRRDEKPVEYSSRYSTIYPGISSAAGSGKGVRESQSIDGGSLKAGLSQRLDRGGADSDVNIQATKASPISPALLRKSPRAATATYDVVHTANIASTSPVVSLPVKSSCKCGAFRSSDSSPGLMGLVVDDRRRGQSPLPASLNTGDTIGRSEGRERRSRELVESSSQGTPSLRSTGIYNSNSGSRINTPNLLQGRLALLEGRVTQIAAELKATKDLLDANNPACSKAVLTDIQLKITGIERAINYRLARECGLVDQLEAEQLKGTYIQGNASAVGSHVLSSEVKRKSVGARVSKALSSGSDIVPHEQGIYGKVSTTVHNSKALTKSSAPALDRTSLPAAKHHSHIASFVPPSRPSRDRHPPLFQCLDQSHYVDDFGGSAPSSQVKPVFDQNEFEERLFPHQKLLRSRPSVHQKLIDNRAALHQKLVENSVLLRNKLAALEERDGLNCGGALDDAGAAEFITSLKQQQLHPGLKFERDFERNQTAKSDSGSSRPLRSIAGEAVIVDSFQQLGSHGYLEFDGDTVPGLTRERRSSRDGRRSSGSRKSFSGTPSEPTSELVFHPLERISSGSRNERRRRSSEKRKSISTSDCYSPEPVQVASQIVMLEPAGKPLSCSPHQGAQLVGPPPKDTVVVDLECAEAFVNENISLEQGGVKELWLAEAQKQVKAEGICPPIRTPNEEAAVIDLGCQESLSSEDVTDDLPDYPTKPNNDDDEEQPYFGECEDNVPGERLHQIGDKIATAGWFISEGDGILLAHDDGCCSFYDVANMEVKANFKGPPNLSSRTWRDCWFVRAAGPDGTTDKYIIAASVGSALDAAFCTWDFYDRRIAAFHSESSLAGSPSSFSFKSSGSSSPERRRFAARDRQKSSCFSWYNGSENAQLLKGRTPSGPLSLDLISGGSCPSDVENLEIPLWWYRPCSPLLASAGSGLKTVTLYDVRDGDVEMKWDVTKWISSMEFSSPIQWRNRSKIVVAEDQSVSVWDVNSRIPQRLHCIDFSGKEIRALYVGDSDAEYTEGIRQRASSRDNLSGDGVVCTQDAVNILDFRVPAGVALKIPTFGETVHSVYANGDSVFAGVTVFSKASGGGSVKGSVQSKVNEWSIKQGRPMSFYKFPESSTHQMHQSVAQVWGNSDSVMAVNGNGLFMFDSLKGALPGRDGGQSAREVLGTDDLVHPTFDRAGNRVLLISQDRPASWCHWP